MCSYTPAQLLLESLALFNVEVCNDDGSSVATNINTIEWRVGDVILPSFCQSANICLTNTIRSCTTLSVAIVTPNTVSAYHQ